MQQLKFGIFSLKIIRDKANMKLEFGVFSRTHTWPLLCSKSEAFNAFHLSSNKKGEVIKRTKVSKGHNNSYSRDIKFAATLALWADLGIFSINAFFSQAQSSLLNNKTHYFVKLKGVCPIIFKNMAILKFQIYEV